MRKKFLTVFCTCTVFVLSSFLFSAPATVWAEIDPPKAYLTTVMYHSILKSKSGKYTVSPVQLKEDIKNFKAEGYNFVFPSEIIAFAEGKKLLPLKPLLISFDDGRYNNLFYGLQILKEENAKACISIVGKFSDHTTQSKDIDNPNYSHLTWEEIGFLSKSGLMEVGSHTYNMHAFSPRYGISKKQNESAEEYISALRKDTKIITEKLFKATGIKPTFFAYPFGKYTTECKKVLIESGYKMMMTCNEGITELVFGKKESAYYIRRYNRSGKVSGKSFLEKIKNDYEKKIKK